MVSSFEKYMKNAFGLVLGLLALIFLLPSALAQEKICAIYFTKIGCPVCARTDPVVLGEWPGKYENLVIIEYVFEDWSEPNAILLGKYNIKYGTGAAVPLLVFENEHALGLPPVFDVEEKIPNMEKKCRLLDKSVYFEDLDFNELPESPKIWANNRLLVRLKKGNVSSDFLKEILFTRDLEGVLKNSSYKIVEIKAEPAPISYGQIEFLKAFKIEDSWILKCNEDITGFLFEENEKAEGFSLNLILIPAGIIVFVIILVFYIIRRRK